MRRIALILVVLLAAAIEPAFAGEHSTCDLVVETWLVCRGDPLTDDPSCWQHDPLGSTRPSSEAARELRNTALVRAQPSSPRPSSRVVLRAQTLGRPLAGYGRSLERPPRICS